MSLFEWFGLASLCLAGAASPGPSLAVVIAATMKGGRPTGLTAAWMHALGVGFYALLTVLGLGALVTANAAVFQAMQVAGALYLLWMARGMWSLAKASTPTLRSEDKELPSSSGINPARDGFAIAFLNPKLAVFMLALFSQFIRPDAGLIEGTVMVGTVFMTDGLWYSLIVILLSRGNWIERLQNNAARVDRTFAVLLSLVASYILWGAISAAL